MVATRRYPGCARQDRAVPARLRPADPALVAPALDRFRAGSASKDDLRLLTKHRSEEHTSELQSRRDLVCRLLLEKKKKKKKLQQTKKKPNQQNYTRTPLKTKLTNAQRPKPATTKKTQPSKNRDNTKHITSTVLNQ